MLKFHLIFIVGIVSIFLLTVQWIILQLAVKNAKPNINYQWVLINQIIKSAFKFNIPLIVIDTKILSQLYAKELKEDDIHHEDDFIEKKFIQSNQFIPLFKSKNENKNSCKYFCSGQKVIHLASLQEVINPQELNKFIQQLRSEQFTVFEFKNFDSDLIVKNIQLSLINHLIIFKDQYVNKKESSIIHITFFKNKLNKFWISNSIHMNEYEKRLVHRQGVRKLHFQFSDYSHVYEKVSLKSRYIDNLIFNYPEDVKIFLQDPMKLKYIECNKTRAIEFYEKYKEDESETALQFKMNAYQLIYKVKNILDELNIPFWLSSGTCLGYFRQCDFITYSQDVDIGIFIKDYKDDLIDAFSINDLPLLHLFGKVEDSFELSFRNGDVKLDIFFFYEEKDYYWNGGTQAKSGLKFKYIFPKFDLCWTEFLDLLIRVPCDTLTYIKSNYGENWYFPVKEWDWKTSPNNVNKNGQWPAEEWDKVIQINPYIDIV